jgi:hypothetical protein
MSPRSSDPRRSILIALAAFALLANAGPAVAARITVTKDSPRPDTIQVKEITIDDEGIRVVGAGRDVHIPGDELPRIDVDMGGGAVRVVQVGPDSMDRIVVHSRGENEIVQFFKDIVVEKGEHPGDVVALFGNVKNFGTIGGDCVAIMGSIEQGDSALILGDAVTIGGALRETGTGARVEGQTVSIGFLPFAGFAIPSVPLLLFFGLFAYALFVGLAALFARLFPERLVRMAETISRRTFLSLVLGLLSGPLALMVGLLLMVTVIGIPLAIILPLLYLLGAFIGFAAATYLLGLKLMGRRADPRGGFVAPLAVGTGFVTLFFVLGMPLIAFEGGFRVVGFSLLTLWLIVGKVCWMIGLGALLLSRLGQEEGPRNETQWSGMGSGGSPAPAPSTAPASAPPAI